MSTIKDIGSKIFERINPAVGFSVRRYVMAVGFFVAIVVFGLISTLGLGVDLFPEMNIPVVVVVTSYPGATPSVIDQQITQVIENQVSTISGITDINSSSSTGRSLVIVHFDQSTDKNADAQQVAAIVAAAVKQLPTGVNPPTVQTFDPNALPILQFGISGQGASLEDVANYVQNDLTPLLERVSGVANVQMDGGPSREFEVLLNPDRLASYNLSPQQVVTAIENSAVNVPIGTIELNKNSLTFATQNVPADVGQIADYVVDLARGITVRDLGSVRDVAVPTDYARVNGKPVVLVSIQQTSDSNEVAVVDGVRQLLDRTHLPTGYSIVYSNDTTGPIRASVQSTYHELFVSALVVAIIVLLFLGRLNTALSVILAIPIALSASPILYRLAGFTFNLVSLLALIVAIGIVVDDSIVVSENVTRYRAMGFGLKEAVLRGASEVFSAVLAASLSILSVVIPVSFIGGFVGAYLQQFTLGLAAAVFFSLLEAILFLTVRLAYTPESRPRTWPDLFESLKGLRAPFAWGLSSWRKPLGIAFGVAILAALAATHHYLYLPLIVLYPFALGLLYYLGRILFNLLESLTSTLHSWTEAGLDWVRERYVGSLGGVLKRPGWVLIGAAAFLVVTVALVAPRIPFNFVPNSDSGTISINLFLPSTTPEDVTNDETAKIESYLYKQPYVAMVQTVVGSGGVFLAGISQPNDANLVVQLTPINERPSVFALIPKYRSDLLRMITADQPSARLQIAAGGGFGGQGNTVQLSLVSPDLNLLTSRNAEALQWLQSNPYVTDVESSLSATTLESDFVPDNQRTKGTGISPAAVAYALQYYTSGFQAGNVWIGGLSYPIMVQLDPTYLAGGQSLLTLPIYSPILSSNLQVGQLGTFVMEEAPTVISRYNRLYTANLQINLAQNAPAILTFQKEITQGMTTAGVLGNGVDLSASSRYGAVALAAQLAVTGPLTFLLAFFLAYLVMGAQFNSWRYPLYLLLPVPLALMGALWLVFALGSGLDLFGILGMLLLIGLSAKNAIIYLDFVVERLGRVPLKEALVDSAGLRFRPIVMTTLTVLVISGPLILGRGEGSEFGRNLGIVMFGGIVFSAILTFFVVPAAFYLFERKRIAARPALPGEAVMVAAGAVLSAAEIPPDAAAAQAAAAAADAAAVRTATDASAQAAVVPKAAGEGERAR